MHRTMQKVTGEGDKAGKTAWGQQKPKHLGQSSGWWQEDLQDMQTNNLFLSETQQVLFKRKLINFPEIVKIFAKSQSQLNHIVLYYS